MEKNLTDAVKVLTTTLLGTLAIALLAHFGG